MSTPSTSHGPTPTSTPLAPGRQSPFERHPRLTLAVLALFLIVGTDFAFTAIYARIRPDFHRDHSVFRVRSEIYHHGFKPLVSVDDERWGPLVSSYRTNSLGMRDRSTRQVPLRAPGRRIVFIGDSFTEGIGVLYEKTFVGLVEEALRPQGIDVLGAGVASFCPIIDYRRTRHLIEDVGLVFDDLVVFIDIGDIQDEVTYKFDDAGTVVSRERRRIAEERANRAYGKPPLFRSTDVERFLTRNTLLLGPGYASLSRWLARGPQRAAAWTQDPTVFDQYAREGLALAREHMDALADLLKSKGIRLTVVVYPWPDLLLTGDRDSLQSRYWRDWSRERGAHFLDLFPSFFDAGPAAEVVKREFIRGDIHWSEAGHRRVAEAFLRNWTSPKWAVGIRPFGSCSSALGSRRALFRRPPTTHLVASAPQPERSRRRLVQAPRALCRVASSGRRSLS